MNITAFNARDALMHGAAERLERALRTGIAARGAACAALSGGSTPEPAYAALARADLDWSKVTFVLVDERFVPPSDPGSNEAMLRRALAPALAKGARLFPMYGPGEAEDAASRADAVYAPLHIDIALMGMGTDGHTASWFPGSPQRDAALDPAGGRTVMAVRAPGAAGASERLTLSFAALSRADHVLLLITGEEKRERLAEAASQSMAQAPVVALLRLGQRFETYYAP
ncbi:MAG TPA: 6-phosphogluconolactonase [Caulobacterales bacterium]|nr:6-phosphogluconolactonase [Caulobacterales bacterium]